MSQISIPGKSFLVGEYSVLNGGPGILLATNPCFKSSYQISTKNNLFKTSKEKPFPSHELKEIFNNEIDNAELISAWAAHFHKDSPAGRLIQLLLIKVKAAIDAAIEIPLEITTAIPSAISSEMPSDEICESTKKDQSYRCEVSWSSLFHFIKADSETIFNFLNGEFSFFDPYHGEGGLGASSAQFLALISFAREHDILGLKDEWDLLQLYRGLSSNGGQPPSGADLLAQNSGGFVVIHENDKTVRRIEWPFTKLNLFFVRTGIKVPTHEHLKDLNTSNFETFKLLTLRIQQSLESTDEMKFLFDMKQFQEELINSDLQIPSSQVMCREAMESGYFVSAKGCGALGADILALISKVTLSALALSWIESKGLKVVATLADVAGGPRVFESEEYL